MTEIPKKTKCLMKKVEGESYELTEVDTPVPKEGELLVKVVKASICGSDIALYKWNKSRFPLKIK